MARTTARMRKAIKIQTPVDLKKDSLSLFRRHSRRPQLLRQQVTLHWRVSNGASWTVNSRWGLEDDMNSGRWGK